jgi:hypothetical protein
MFHLVSDLNHLVCVFSQRCSTFYVRLFNAPPPRKKIIKKSPGVLKTKEFGADFKTPKNAIIYYKKYELKV